MVHCKYFTPQICDTLQVTPIGILRRKLRIDQRSSWKLLSHGNGCVYFLKGESQTVKYVNCTKVFPICSNLSHFIQESPRTTLCYIFYGPTFTPSADKLNSQNYKNLQTLP
jgi:hypothetical protein